MLADNSETFNRHSFEDAAVLAARASGDHEIEALICKGLAAAYRCALPGLLCCRCGHSCAAPHHDTIR